MPARDCSYRSERPWLFRATLAVCQACAAAGLLGLLAVLLNSELLSCLKGQNWCAEDQVLQKPDQVAVLKDYQEENAAVLSIARCNSAEPQS